MHFQIGNPTARGRHHPNSHGKPMEMEPSTYQLPVRSAQLLLTPRDRQVMCPGRAHQPQLASPCSHPYTATKSSL